MLGVHCFPQTNIKDLENRSGKWILRSTEKPFTGKFIEYFIDGSIKGRGKIVGGLLEGERVMFSEKGDTLFVRNYHEGKAFGFTKEFYENGRPKQEGELKNNKENGLWRFYRKDGTLESEFSYVNGKQEGECREYDAGGKLIKKYYLEAGEINYGRKVKSLMAKGLKKYTDKAYQDAVDLFTQAIEENNTIAEAYFDRGVCRGMLVNHKAAIADYDTAIVINPMYKEAYLNRGCAEINLSLQSKSDPEGLKMKEAGCLDLKKALQLGLNTREIQQMIQFHCEGKKGE